MNEGWKIVLSLSLSGTLLLFLLMLCRPFLKKRVSCVWQYYIWLAVIFRLLLPVTAPVNLTGMVLRPAEAFWQQQGEILQQQRSQAPGGQETVLTQGQEADGGAQNLSGASGKAPAAEETGPFMEETSGGVLTFLWLLTALVLFGRKLSAWHRYRSKLAENWRPACAKALLSILEEQKKKTGILKNVPVYIHPGVSSPMLIGVFRPCIVLPEENLPQERMAYILRHELIHDKRHDPAYKWLVQICLCLHWFNPFMKRLESETQRACELACDEAVMKGMDAGQRRAYGDTLLEIMRDPLCQKVPAVMLLEGKEQVKERLGAIMSYQKTTGKMRVLGGVMAVLTGVCAVFAGAWASPLYAWGAMPDTADNISSAQPGGRAEAENEIYGMKEKYDVYIQDSYYQEPYILEIGWNIPSQKAEEFPYSSAVLMPDGRNMTWYFSEDAKPYLQDEGVRMALSKVYPSLQKKGEKSQLPIETPFLSRVRDVSGKTVEELAAESYREEQLTIFSAVFPELKDDEKEMYLNRMYEEGEVSFFAASLRGVSKEKIRELNQKAFRDGAANFFVMTFVWMEEDEMVELIQRAHTEGENAMFSVAVGAADLSEESWNTLLEQARRERWGSFYISLLEMKMKK